MGEALVGNEAVDQLTKFNQALADHSNMDKPHLIDGILLTKFDTIDDKVGVWFIIIVYFFWQFLHDTKNNKLSQFIMMTVSSNGENIT